MDHLQNHCKDSLLILSLCQHQKLAGYFCLGRCTFCCKGLFILCLPCSQVMFSTIMQKEICDSLCHGVFFLTRTWGKKEGNWCLMQLLLYSCQSVVSQMCWSELSKPAARRLLCEYCGWPCVCMWLKKKKDKRKKIWRGGTLSLAEDYYADCLEKNTLGSQECALELAEGGGGGGWGVPKKLISISFKAMLKCLQGWHAGLHMSLFNYMCWKKKMAVCKVIC